MYSLNPHIQAWPAHLSGETSPTVPARSVGRASAVRSGTAAFDHGREASGFSSAPRQPGETCLSLALYDVIWRYYDSPIQNLCFSSGMVDVCLMTCMSCGFSRHLFSGKAPRSLRFLHLSPLLFHSSLALIFPTLPYSYEKQTLPDIVTVFCMTIELQISYIHTHCKFILKLPQLL